MSRFFNQISHRQSLGVLMPQQHCAGSVRCSIKNVNNKAKLRLPVRLDFPYPYPVPSSLNERRYGVLINRASAFFLYYLTFFLAIPGIIVLAVKSKALAR